MTTSPAGILGLRDHPDFPTRSPRLTISSHSSISQDWPRPTGSMADVLVDGYAYGSLSMTAFTLDADCSQRLVLAMPPRCRVLIWYRRTTQTRSACPTLPTTLLGGTLRYETS